MPSGGDVNERRFYLNLKSDSTLTLDGAPVQANGLDPALRATTNNDKNARIIICSDESVPHEQVVNLAEHVKAAGFNSRLITARSNRGLTAAFGGKRR
jgi:biopolymer transport protein ExbD